MFDTLYITLYAKVLIHNTLIFRIMLTTKKRERERESNFNDGSTFSFPLYGAKSSRKVYIDCNSCEVLRRNAIENVNSNI